MAASSHLAGYESPLARARRMAQALQDAGIKQSVPHHHIGENGTRCAFCGADLRDERHDPPNVAAGRIVSRMEGSPSSVEPRPPIIALTHNDLAELLIEECAEIIEAAQKCKRFGFDRVFPGYGQNGAALAYEMGDAVATIEALMSFHPELAPTYTKARNSKIARALKAKADLLEELERDARPKQS